MQLIDAKLGTELADAPSKEALVGNGAQLLKDVLQSIAWNCARLLASDGFRIVPGNLADLPSSLVDPLAAFAAQAHGQSPTPSAPPAAVPAATATPADPATPAYH